KFPALPRRLGLTPGDYEMKIRPFLIAVLASASLASPFVMAHPGGHDDDEKAMPKTCEQLADTKRYISDVAYPEVKKLKEQCDAAKKKPNAAQSPAARGSSNDGN
ncbi:MAG: hypothetical protein E6801_24585, partial [Pseudomonas aeruginosa]|nr:hypothetical protein [Pseudomonas aeruginosa]